MLGDVGPYGNYVVSIVFFLVGLSLLDVLPLSWAVPDASAWRARGLPAALGLGLIFGLALGPCTFAYMAPMLGVVFAVGRASVGYGLLSSARTASGTARSSSPPAPTTEWVSGYLRWHERARAGARLRHACGVLVLGGGLWFIYTA